LETQYPRTGHEPNRAICEAYQQFPKACFVVSQIKSPSIRICNPELSKNNAAGFYSDGAFFVGLITDALAVSASESFRSCKLAAILESNTEPNFSGIGHGSCVFS